MNVSNAQGKVTYKLTGVKRGKSKKYKKYFKINATTLKSRDIYRKSELLLQDVNSVPT